MKKVLFTKYVHVAKELPRLKCKGVGIVLQEDSVRWKIQDLDTGQIFWRLPNNVKIMKTKGEKDGDII